MMSASTSSVVIPVTRSPIGPCPSSEALFRFSRMIHGGVPTARTSSRARTKLFPSTLSSSQQPHYSITRNDHNHTSHPLLREYIHPAILHSAIFLVLDFRNHTP